MKSPADPEGRTLEDIRDNELQLGFLADLAQATEPMSDPALIMEVTARMLGTHLLANRCAYAEVESDQDRFQITGDYNDGVTSIVGRFAFSDFGAAVLSLMRANQPFIVDDVDSDPRTAGMDKAAYRITSIQAVICLPLHKDNRLVAAMAVHQRTVRLWTPQEIELVGLVVARCWESLERSRSDRRLKETNSRLGLALEAANMGDWAWDAVTDVLSVSRRTELLLGWKADPRATWSEFKHFISPEDLPVVEAEIERAKTSDGRYRAEYRLTTPGRNEVWLAAWGIVQRTASGAFAGIAGVVQDVTVRKHLEQELQAKATALVDADRRKDEFLATLAHELRNPLAPIRTAAEILGHPRVPADQAMRAVDVVRRQVSQMSRLLDDLLDVARITRRALHLKKERVDLRSIVAAAVETVGPMIDARRHRLVLRLVDADQGMDADPLRITQVLCNLLTNAAKYTDPGGTITISTQATPVARILKVGDTGIGLTPAATKRIFGMFMQETSVLERSEGGLGIGLALAKGLVLLHQGTIDVFSEGLGRGSEFIVSLPAAPAGSNEAVTTLEPLPKTVLPQRVLVADDNRDGADSVAAFLRLDGHEVEVVNDGESALRQARANRPSVMVLDIGMPGMNGYEVAKAIRGEVWGSDIRLVAVTGWGQESDRALAFEAGFDQHLTKPFDPEKLLAFISS